MNKNCVIRDFDVLAFKKEFDSLAVDIHKCCFDEEGNIPKFTVLHLKGTVENRIADMNVVLHELEDLIQYL